MNQGIGGNCSSSSGLGGEDLCISNADDFVVMLVEFESNSQVWPDHCRILYDCRGEGEMIVDLERMTLDQVDTVFSR